MLCVSTPARVSRHVCAVPWIWDLPVSAPQPNSAPHASLQGLLTGQGCGEASDTAGDTAGMSGHLAQDAGWTALAAAPGGPPGWGGATVCPSCGAGPLHVTCLSCVQAGQGTGAGLLGPEWPPRLMLPVLTERGSALSAPPSPARMARVPVTCRGATGAATDTSPMSPCAPSTWWQVVAEVATPLCQHRDWPPGDTWTPVPRPRSTPGPARTVLMLVLVPQASRWGRGTVRCPVWPTHTPTPARSSLSPDFCS